MKKLIFGLLLLNVTNVWADRITSGPIGLILPSTGVVSGRPPGDKLNFNFEVIAASIAGIIGGNPPIAGGTGVNIVTIYDEGSPQGNINTLNVTGTQAQITVVGATGTLNITAGSGGGSDNLGSHQSTKTLSLDRFGIAASTGLEVGEAQLTIVWSTASLKDEHLSIATRTIAETNTLVTKEEGSSLGGDVKSINFVGALVTVTQSGSTGTVTISGSPGGASDNMGSHMSTRPLSMQSFGIAGSTGLEVGDVQFTNYMSTTHAEIQRRSLQAPYSLVIGSYGAPGVDMYVDTLEQWNMALGSVGVRGLTWSTTAYATIYSKNQKAGMAGGVVPAGVTVIFSASSTWVDDSDQADVRFLDIYGKLYNARLSLGTVSYSVTKITMSSGSKLIDSTIFESTNIRGGFLNSHTLRIKGEDIEVLNLDIAAAGVAGVAMYGDAGPVRVIQSSGVVLDFARYRSYPTGFAANVTNIQVTESTRVTVSGIFDNMNGNGINFAQGNVDSGISMRPNGRPTIFEYASQLPGDVGTVIMGDNSGTTLGTSSSPYVHNANFIFRGAGVSSAIRVTNAIGRETTGLSIKNVTVTCYAGATDITAITLNTGSLNTVIDNVDVNGCLSALSDSGRNTNKAGLRKNAITQ